MIKNKAQKQKLLSPEAYIKEKARQLPIVECYIGTKWDYMGGKDSYCHSSTSARTLYDGSLFGGYLL